MRARNARNWESLWVSFVGSGGWGSRADWRSFQPFCDKTIGFFQVFPTKTRPKPIKLLGFPVFPKSNRVVYPRVLGLGVFGFSVALGFFETACIEMNDYPCLLCLRCFRVGLLQNFRFFCTSSLEHQDKSKQSSKTQQK